MSVVAFPRGYELDRYTLHDLDSRLTVSVDTRPDGSDYCICWIATAGMVSTDSGGFMAEGDGIAVGIDSEGKVLVDNNWEGEIFGFEPTESIHIATIARVAQFIAGAATELLPLVRDGLDRGVNLDQVEAAVDSTIQREATSKETRVIGELMRSALGLLWLAEQDRRETLET